MLAENLGKDNKDMLKDTRKKISSELQKYTLNKIYDNVYEFTAACITLKERIYDLQVSQRRAQKFSSNTNLKNKKITFSKNTTISTTTTRTETLAAPLQPHNRQSTSRTSSKRLH